MLRLQLISFDGIDTGGRKQKKKKIGLPKQSSHFRLSESGSHGLICHNLALPCGVEGMPGMQKGVWLLPDKDGRSLDG